MGEKGLNTRLLILLKKHYLPIPIPEKIIEVTTMIKSGISYIDLGILFVLLFFLYKGYARGFTEEFMRIFGTLVSLIVAIRYMSDLSKIIIGATSISPIVAIVLSFAALFFITIYGFKFITDKLKKAINFSVALGGVDKIVGGVLGCAKGAIFISLITKVSFGMTYFVSPRGNDNTGNGSQFAPWRSIQYTIDQASPGDTLKVVGDDNVLTNDYTENIVITKI